MKCPYCRNQETEVYNTRTTKFATQIWRRRRCQKCSKTFTTYEAADLGFLTIKPKTGKAQRYSRAKLYASLSAAFLPDTQNSDTVDAVTDTLEAKILDLQQTELSQADIVRLALSTLKHFDAAAFLRYLSSHAELASKTDLKRELGKY